MSRAPGKQFDSNSGRLASLKSPWRRQSACQSEKAEALRDGFNNGCSIQDAGGLLGISAGPGRRFAQIRDFLISAGWTEAQLVRVYHENDAAMVRQRGGLVVHIEVHPRPSFAADITSARMTCKVGDYVLEGANNPGEYLPRLLTLLSAVQGAARD